MLSKLPRKRKKAFIKYNDTIEYNTGTTTHLGCGKAIYLSNRILNDIYGKTRFKQVTSSIKEFMLILDLALDPRGLARIEKMYNQENHNG
jgi:hypothetical protein